MVGFGGYLLVHLILPTRLDVLPRVRQVQQDGTGRRRLQHPQGGSDDPNLVVEIERFARGVAERVVEEGGSWWIDLLGDVPATGDGRGRYPVLLQVSREQSNGLMAHWSDGYQEGGVHVHLLKPPEQPGRHLLREGRAAEHPPHEGEDRIGDRFDEPLLLKHGERLQGDHAVDVAVRVRLVVVVVVDLDLVLRDAPGDLAEGQVVPNRVEGFLVREVDAGGAEHADPALRQRLLERRERGVIVVTPSVLRETLGAEISLQPWDVVDGHVCLLPSPLEFPISAAPVPLAEPE